jgi:hypothetical protein
MNRLTRILAATTIACAGFAMPAAWAGETDDASRFVTMVDANKDGMVSKAEMMKHVEKMFEKHDTKKMGKLDKAQAAKFMKDLMNYSGA